MAKPKLSIIVPTYNSEATIEACLRSIQAQTYSNIELILADNNSSDRTRDISRQYTEHLFIAGPERSSQRNQAAERATGRYLLFIDSDMELAPEVADQVVSEFENTEHAALIVPEETTGSGYIAAVRWFERRFYEGVEWIEAARAFRKQAFIDAGGYNEDLVSGEDWDLSQRVGKTGRIEARIKHNEGAVGLFAHLKKKFYYAKHLGEYSQQHMHESAKQLGIFSRIRLFLARPGLLLSRPDLAAGMFLLKFLEFCVYLAAKVRLRLQK